MCGRYRLSRRKQIVEEYFDCAPDELDCVPRYICEPTFWVLLQPSIVSISASKKRGASFLMSHPFAFVRGSSPLRTFWPCLD